MAKSSSNKEDYLKAIYENNGIDEFVSNKTLSNHLKVSPASVTEMVEKLRDDQLLEYKPYTGVKLTLAGLNQTISIIRNHRIIETFLFTKLGYSLHEIHHLSEELEHVKDPIFFNRLYKYLDEPKTCPHGGIIPTVDNYRESALKSIATCQSGESIILERVLDDSLILNYLASIDLKIGDTINIITIDSFNELMVFTINHSKQTFHLNLKQAQLLFTH
ncbi:metal-dependent transcriptional regulator [Vagococcus vulneris]|uniref:Manganese transport regulator n=1 Tax=Vagococcus vulneris TaxID=1977869 RepID=A0A429ZX21_9ENTE|nr:metal-dependent transcriptional regulator [Vagococcus vulneris]RST98379.1 hypothetical protein CBF37_07650 [Vagococcus vulneris]